MYHQIPGVADARVNVSMGVITEFGDYQGVVRLPLFESGVEIFPFAVTTSAVVSPVIMNNVHDSMHVITYYCINNAH